MIYAKINLVTGSTISKNIAALNEIVRIRSFINLIMFICKRESFCASVMSREDLIYICP